MKIKYTGLHSKIFISLCLGHSDFEKHFTRNVWTSVPSEEIAKALIKSPYFISEKNLIFDHKTTIRDTILLRRGCALGDLIQLIPVIKYLKTDMNLKFDLWTSPSYVEIMEWFGVFGQVYDRQPSKKYKHLLVLDGVLESDHSLTNHERAMHRIKIFEQFFKIQIDKYDFSPE